MRKLVDSPSLWKHLEAPRDSYKTSLLIAKAVRKILANRNTRLLWYNATDEEAQKYTGQIRGHLRGEAVTSIFGKVEADDSSDNFFVVNGRTLPLKEPTLTSGSVEKNVTGSHFDDIIADDLVTWLNSRTDAGIKKVRASFNMLIPLLDPGGELILNGTRYNDADLSGDVVNTMSDRFEILVLDCGMQPVQMPDGRWVLEGQPSYAHLTERYLEDRLQIMGPADFSAQYCNNFLPAGAASFRRSDFRLGEWEGWMDGMSSWIVTDTATTSNEAGCFSVLGVVSLDRDQRLYLQDLDIGHWQPDDLVRRLGDMIERWRPKLSIRGILWETIALNKVFSSMFERELKRRQIPTPRNIPMSRGVNSQSKDQRIRRLVYRFPPGDFVVMRSVPRYYSDMGQQHVLFDPEGYRQGGVILPDGELVRQFVRFPGYGKKDIPDAIADIDEIDTKGRRLCIGQTKKAVASAGQIIPSAPRMVNGRIRLVNNIQPNRGDRWSRLARR